MSLRRHLRYNVIANSNKYHSPATEFGCIYKLIYAYDRICITILQFYTILHLAATNFIHYELMTSHNSTTNHAEEELQRRPSPCYSMSSRASSAFSYIGLMGYVMPIQTLVTRSRDRARIRKKNQIDRRESLSPWVVHRKLACNWHLFFSQAIQIIHIALGNTCKYNLYIYTKCHKKIQIKKKKTWSSQSIESKILACDQKSQIHPSISKSYMISREIDFPTDGLQDLYPWVAL